MIWPEANKYKGWCINLQQAKLVIGVQLMTINVFCMLIMLLVYGI